MLTLAEARTAILAAVRPVGTEETALAESLGRVAAGDLVAGRGLPLFDRSAMDGYALRSADTAGAAREKPATLRVVGMLPAGGRWENSLERGQALRILTGAPLPPGADGVEIQEAVDRDGEQVRLHRFVPAGANVVPAASEVAAGSVLLPGGAVLIPPALSLLAAERQSKIRVYRRPRVAVFSTGDELAPPGVEPGPGRIPDQNGITLVSLVWEAGAEVAFLGIAPDDPSAVAHFLRQAAGYDLVVSSGGVSVGDRDHLPAVLEQLGAAVVFRGVRMRPGRACLGAVLNGAPVLALSGNPGASYLGFQLLGRPLLRKLGGHRHLFRPVCRVRLAQGYPKPSPHQRFLRAKLVETVDGYLAHLEKGQGSADMVSFLGANALAVLPAGSGPLEAGAQVEAIRLDMAENN